MSKKVGIISFQNANNYGAVLQLFALQTVVKKFGKTPEIINYESDIFDPEDGQILIFKMFKNEYLNMTKKYKDGFTLSGEEYESVITGSDQVWNTELTKNDANYFLKFVKDKSVRKIAYAASTGSSDEIIGDLRELISKYARDFYRVSLREPTRLPLVQEYYDMDIPVTLDPTQLLEKEDYTNIIKLTPFNESGYILLFKIWPYDRLKDFANMLSLQRDKKLIAMSDIESEYSFVEGSSNYNFPFIENWLTLINNAGLVITDSFHGLMFSIIFRKPFYVWAEDGPRADRIKSILTKLGFEERLLKDDISLSDIDFNLDYTYAEEVLKKEREESLEHLRDALF